AVNANGESTNSVEANATPVASTPPSTPSGLTALRDDGQVSLSWNATPGATSYNVKRSILSGGTFVNVASSTTTNHTDTGLTNGPTYFYEVSALGAGAESSNSAQVAVTPTSMSYLVGTITGTTGSWSNIGNTREKAMDGNVNTFFDAPTGDGD